MRPKPAHFGEKYASQFSDASVVATYRFRPPYPRETFEILARLITCAPRRVLEVGCGPGSLTIPLSEYVDFIDAVDPSPGMIVEAKRLGATRTNVRWIEAGIEAAPLHGPYALIAAAESLHWTDWEIVFPRLRATLLPGGKLAIVGRVTSPLPCNTELTGLIARYSTNREFRPSDDLVTLLKERGLFFGESTFHTAPESFEQSIADYVESIHSRNGFSRNRMRSEDAAEFDTAVGEVLAKTFPDGLVRMEVRGQVVAGRIT